MLLSLGRAIQNALHNLLRNPELTIPFLAAAHVEGQRVARTVHGLYLRASPRLSPREARAWRSAALEHAENAATLAAQNLSGREITRAALRQYSEAVTRATVWTGQDTEAARLAMLHDVEWKEWVRAFPRGQHRDHHDAMEGVIIPIASKFTLPGGPFAGSLVYGPRAWDDLSAPSEWLNCGHALRFHKSVTRDQLRRTS